MNDGRSTIKSETEVKNATTHFTPDLLKTKHTASYCMSMCSYVVGRLVLFCISYNQFSLYKMHI